MKHLSSTLRRPPFLSQLNQLFDVVMSGLDLWVSKPSKGASHLLTQLQKGRMQSVMQSMTHEELQKIDLERNHIRRRAEFLMTNENDSL